ncbi:hypothetical protein J1N35_028471 [Gossypium stocksii]|uniref:RNase H type-1 domain-containing protein n=1 Tax=Gossypium stocksii TaxID=47602 RepID=A0A9D3UXY6_9ROSI|nr:hypothetical protein J1N35_028471 [Gossypium stocksii]
MNVERVRRGIGSDNTCRICGHDLEELLHVLRVCPMAKDIWNKLIPIEKQVRFYFRSFHEWMTENLQTMLSFGSNGIDWSCLFGMISWCIWKNHNSFVFRISLGARRKSSRSLIVGYLGCSVLERELWGILDGLDMSLDQDFKYILIQTDSCEAFNAIQEAFVGDSKSTLIRIIHQLLSKVLHWSIQHPSR